jgi:hypothetical protein
MLNQYHVVLEVDPKLLRSKPARYVTSQIAIGDDRMPKRIYHAYGYVKKAAALVNAVAGRLAQWKANAIVRAADEAIVGKLDDHFPLYVWQTGFEHHRLHGVLQLRGRPTFDVGCEPDTLWLYREALAKAGAVEELFDLFDGF